jgi:hypothetical protein
VEKVSKYVGVIWSKKENKWRAKICFDKKQVYIGYFDSDEEAFNEINLKKKELGLKIQSFTECMPLENEIFKPIPNNEEYEISNLSRVKSLKFGRETILNQKIGRGRYFHVVINGKNFRVHKLVAMAFLNHKPDGTQRIVVDHISGNPLDNRLSNLQLITQRENTSKDRKNGTSEYIGVSLKKNGKFKAQIVNNRKNISLGTFEAEEEASEYYQNALKSIENGEEIVIKKTTYSSKYTGVSFCKKLNKWRAMFNLNEKSKHIGYFLTEKEAYLEREKVISINK